VIRRIHKHLIINQPLNKDRERMVIGWPLPFLDSQETQVDTAIAAVEVHQKLRIIISWYICGGKWLRNSEPELVSQAYRYCDVRRLVHLRGRCHLYFYLFGPLFNVNVHGQLFDADYSQLGFIRGI